MKDLIFSNSTFMLKSALIGAIFLISSLCSAAPFDPLTVTLPDGTDIDYMAKQRASVNRLAIDHLGTPIRGNIGDLATLQRIIDETLIKSNDKLTLQALGVVLGDAFMLKEPTLSWKIYEDKRGRSRALCIRQTQDCLFPITMLSRRMKAGLTPNVKKIFVEALYLISTKLPELPYGVKRKYTAD